MGISELAMCSFCREVKSVERTYLLPSKFVKPEKLEDRDKLYNQGDYFIVIHTCSDCGKPNFNTPQLNTNSVKERFFFFTYSYWSEKTKGKGSLSLKSNQEFLNQKQITKLAIKKVMDRCYEPEHTVTVVVDSWIEMSEEDYNNWIS